MIQRRFLIMIAACAGILFAGCTMTNHVTLNDDGSGEARAEVTVAAAFAEYLQSFAFLSPDLAYLSDGIFQEELLIEETQKSADIEVFELATEKIVDPADPDRTPGERLSMGIRFDSVDQLMQNEETIARTDILNFESGADGKTLSIYLDKNNYRQLYTLIPMLDNPLFEGLGPGEDAIDEEEYVDMMVGVLGTEGPDLLRNSVVDLIVTVNGEIINQTGGTVEGSTVTFRLPLLRVLLLNRAVEYSLTFK